MKKFRKLKDGQWSTTVRPVKDMGYLHMIKCCDCGLVHLMQHELTARGLRFCAWRKG